MQDMPAMTMISLAGPGGVDGWTGGHGSNVRVLIPANGPAFQLHLLNQISANNFDSCRKTQPFLPSQYKSAQPDQTDHLEPRSNNLLPHPQQTRSVARSGQQNKLAMSHLGSHLEQIHYSCQGIDLLPSPVLASFPPPKIFTNALLSRHDITSLIRDTESHERALFSVPAPPPPVPASTASKRAPEAADAKTQQPAAKRRQTVFNVTTTGDVVTTTGPRHNTQPQPARKHTAVAAVLGGSMHQRLQRSDAAVDVEVLLRGAETLCGVYELPGARERIASLRAKWRNGRETVAYYEARVAEQAVALAGLSRNWIDEEDEGPAGEEGEGDVWTVEDLKREEEQARELETKKKELQARLRAMEKDLGGLRSM
ncbi:DASH subunit Spc34 [Cordyceps militaris]|uniref:DASH complex subunit SPC34 n=1 Tax=Cordyceps militaris TaxID=73501 RepID=A0A2H4STJ3_CORMI|nr:DASH subunit Spc34 [Cordyceps militaris]